MSRLEELKAKAAEDKSSTSNAGETTVDYDAMNKYIVETVGIEQEETVIGVISGIIKLGKQEQEDGKMDWVGTEDEEKEEILSKPDTYFETEEDGKRYKRWSVKPVDSVALTVDFPEIIIDKGQFFGESNPAPLRICMNGKFWRKELKVMDLGRVYPLNLRKNSKTNNRWSLLPNNTLYKMAVGSKIIEQGEPFLPQDIINLLGKSLLFKVKVYFNDIFYNEKITYAAGLMRGQEVPTYNEDLLFYVGWDIENDEKSIKFLTNPVINRMRMSAEWEASAVKEQIERIKYFKEPEKETVDKDQEFDPDDMPF